MVLQPCRYHSRNVVVCLYMGSQDYITTIIEVQFGNNTCYYPLLCRGSSCRFTALYARQWSFSCRLSCGCNINVLVGVCPYSFQRWECYTHLSRHFTCLNVDKRHLSTGWWRPIFSGWGVADFTWFQTYQRNQDQSWMIPGKYFHLWKMLLLTRCYA